MKKILQNLLSGILAGLLVCFLASCQDLTGPQGESGKDGRDAVPLSDIGEVISAALEAKTQGDDGSWIVKLSGLDLSDSYTARHIFHGVAEGIPEGGIDLDLSDCTGVFFVYNPGIPPRDKTRYTGLTLPDSLTNINDGSAGAFTGFSALKNISASGLLRVGHAAFYGCTVLETLDLPNVTDIGDFAFAPNIYTTVSDQYANANNTTLTRVDLPKVKTIGQYAFFRCIAIAEVNLPELISIKRSAFSGVGNAPNTVLETVNLPKAVSLGIGAFEYCPAISTIDLPAANELLGHAFGAYNTALYPYPNTVLKSVTLPEAATVVAAFVDCTALEEAYLPAAGYLSYTFQGCTSLKTVYAPELTTVGPNVFEGCTSLVSLDLPRAISLGASAFKGCDSLAALKAPALINIDNAAFEGCTVLKTLELPNLQGLASTVFTNCTALTSLKLGPNVPILPGTNVSPQDSGIFLNTRYGSPAITIWVPAASLEAYANADWQKYNTGETGWISTAENGHPATWGTNHKQIIMATY